MTLCYEFYDIPELANLPVAEAAKRWRDFTRKDVLSYFAGLIILVPLILLSFAAIRLLLGQPGSSISMFTAALVGGLLSQPLVRLIQIARFRRVSEKTN
jgi:hypothetical protein